MQARPVNWVQCHHRYRPVREVHSQHDIHEALQYDTLCCVDRDIPNIRRVALEHRGKTRSQQPPFSLFKPDRLINRQLINPIVMVMITISLMSINMLLCRFTGAKHTATTLIVNTTHSG